VGWRPTPEIGEMPPWRQAGGAGANPARDGGEGGSGEVLEHEEAVGDWFEETEERGAHQKWHLHGTTLCRRGLVDGGSVPWSGWPTSHPKNIVETGACLLR
jgi:hypothetical protein